MDKQIKNLRGPDKMKRIKWNYARHMEMWWIADEKGDGGYTIQKKQGMYVVFRGPAESEVRIAPFRKLSSAKRVVRIIKHG